MLIDTPFPVKTNSISKEVVYVFNPANYYRVLKAWQQVKTKQVFTDFCYTYYNLDGDVMPPDDLSKCILCGGSNSLTKDTLLAYKKAHFILYHYEWTPEEADTLTALSELDTLQWGIIVDHIPKDTAIPNSIYFYIQTNLDSYEDENETPPDYDPNSNNTSSSNVNNPVSPSTTGQDTTNPTNSSTFAPSINNIPGMQVVGNEQQLNQHNNNIGGLLITDTKLVDLKKKSGSQLVNKSKKLHKRYNKYGVVTDSDSTTDTSSSTETSTTESSDSETSSTEDEYPNNTRRLKQQIRHISKPNKGLVYTTAEKTGIEDMISSVDQPPYNVHQDQMFTPVPKPRNSVVINRKTNGNSEVVNKPAVRKLHDDEYIFSSDEMVTSPESYKIPKKKKVFVRRHGKYYYHNPTAI